LITGTNRNKTLEEIISDEGLISEAGWVQIHVVGIDAIKAVLSKLHEREEISWLAGMREQTEQTNVNMQLPPETIINNIKEHAKQCGLNFTVQPH